MMSPRRVFASIASASLAASACIASGGPPTSSWFTQTQATTLSTASGGPEAAVGVAEGGLNTSQQGPRVSLYAEVSAVGGSRRVRANFHLEDDAYVLVGHIDADGILRIEFPDSPLDAGFAKGHASYQTAEFFAGFTNEYRARFNSGYNAFSSSAKTDSYDGGFGYVFVIASWQPMHFDRFSTQGAWDAFEVSDADYLKDPRPAVYELASLLAGQNPDAYTVQFARLFDTRSVYAGMGSSLDNAYGAQLCSGFGYGFTSGFPRNPFEFSLFNPLLTYGYGQSFYSHGALYEYSLADDCYFSSPSNNRYAYYSPFGYGFGYNYPYGYYGYGQNPGGTTPPATGGGRFIGIDQIRRSPVSPQTAPMQVAPGGGTDVGATNASHMTLAPGAPEYRTRGLVAHEDPAGGEPLAPRAVGNGRRARDAGSDRPGIHGMVIRGGNSDDGVVRASTPRSDAPRAVPQARTETPRVEAPHVERSAPPPAARVEAPRSEPARSSPPPAASSSSSGKPPGRN